MAFSRANRSNLLTLKGNVQTDPRSLGFAALLPSKDYREVSALMNAPSRETLDVATISIGDLQGSVDATEFESLTDSKRALWLSLLQSAEGGGVEATNENIRAQILSVWGTGTTGTTLVALQSRLATEMELLFGENATCTPQAIGRALNQD